MSCSDVLRGALADGALGLSQEQKAAHCFVYMERALQDHLTAQWDHKTHREMQEKSTLCKTYYETRDGERERSVGEEQAWVNREMTG